MWWLYEMFQRFFFISVINNIPVECTHAHSTFVLCHCFAFVVLKVVSWCHPLPGFASSASSIEVKVWANCLTDYYSRNNHLFYSHVSSYFKMWLINYIDQWVLYRLTEISYLPKRTLFLICHLSCFRSYGALSARQLSAVLDPLFVPSTIFTHSSCCKSIFGPEKELLRSPRRQSYSSPNITTDQNDHLRAPCPSVSHTHSFRSLNYPQYCAIIIKTCVILDGYTLPKQRFQLVFLSFFL